MSSCVAGMRSAHPFGVDELEREADPPPTTQSEPQQEAPKKRDKSTGRINACPDHATGSLYPQANRLQLPQNAAVGSSHSLVQGLAGCGRTPPVATHASFRRPLRCESLLCSSTAALPRLDVGEKPRTWLGPGFFRSLLGLEQANGCCRLPPFAAAGGGWGVGTGIPVRDRGTR
jgi:hypothetical protein